MGLTVRIHADKRDAVVVVSGELDVSTGARLEEMLLRVTQVGSPQLLLDLSAVSFMDCAALGALVRIRRAVESRHGSIRLIATSAAVHRVIDLTGMQDAFAGQGSAEKPRSTSHPVTVANLT